MCRKYLPGPRRRAGRCSIQSRGRGRSHALCGARRREGNIASELAVGAPAVLALAGATSQAEA